MSTSKALLISFMIASLVFVVSSRDLGDKPKYKKGDCVEDLEASRVRKVRLVREYVYNYCLMRDNVCEGEFSMRIRDFDRLMNKTDCPEEK